MDIKEAIKKNDKKSFVAICNQRYLTNEEIRRRIPRGWDTGDIFTQVHRFRRYNLVPTPLLNQQGQAFSFCLTPYIQSAQSTMDRFGYDALFENISEKAIKKIEQDNLLEEAFFSSQIEGAKTTRRRAEEMVRQKSAPRNKSERETLNNYRAMEYILAHPELPISLEAIKTLHRIVTNQALDFGTPGEFRSDQDETVVGDWLKIDYVPPPREKMEIFLDDLMGWINQGAKLYEANPHPLIIASIFHFYFVFLHPFPDGNGRTARALYYMYLNKSYNAMPYLSISHVIGEKRNRYDKAILNVEKSGTDLTYFIHYSCDITTTAIGNLRVAIQRYSTAGRLEELIGDLSLQLNKRQIKIMKYLLRPNISQIDVKKYQKLNKVVYETARTDLQGLEQKELIVSQKFGKKFVYKIKEEIHGE